jgi:hypothetical protein
MFQFPRFPLRHKGGVLRLFIEAGSPIRRSPAKLARQLTEAFRSLAASFIGFQRLGIHHAPVVALTTNPLPPQLRAWIPQVALYSFVNVRPGLLSAGLPGRRVVPFGRGAHRQAASCEAGSAPAGLPGAPDLSTARSGNCQGSCRPVFSVRYVVEPGGLEPPTSALQRRRSPN